MVRFRLLKVGAHLGAEKSAPERELEALATEWRVWGYRLALKITGCPEAAEDALQEALLRALAGYGRLRSSAASASWFRQIVVRCALAQVPDRTRTALANASEKAAGGDLEQDLAVRRTLAKLRPEQRGILALAIGEGMTYEEIACCLDIPEGTVASRLHAAKQAFRAIWEEGAK